MPDSGPPWQALQDVLAGQIVDDPQPTTFNARFHHLRPQAIVRCASPEDVAATLAFLRDHELAFVPRSGGHCFAGESSTDGVVLDVSLMDQVSPDGDIVTVGAGARLGAVADRLQQDDRALPAGTCPTVGVAGLALAGGLGVLGRRYGLTSDQMVAAEIVLADGRVLTCDEQHDRDLFWALRGAGAARFGVVTSFVFRTVPAPEATNIHLAWPAADAAAVVDAWQRWLPTAPEEMSAASLKLRISGDVDEPPAVDFYGVFLGSPPEATEILGPLAANTTWTSQRQLSFPETRQFWADLPPAGAPPASSPGDGAQNPWFVAKSEFFRQPLPQDAIATVLANFTRDRGPGEERELDFMPWGGAYNRVAPDATAFAHRDEMFQLKHSATVDPAATDAAKRAAQSFVRRSWDVVHPWGSGGVFPAFPDPDLPDPAAAYYGANLPRLREVKARYDPEGFFGTGSGQGL